MRPCAAARPGGSLVLRADEREPLHLTAAGRGSGGGMLTLSEADGGMLPPELLRQLLFGVSREVYRNVFGFSLSELESFESLSAEGVRNALYGASFGPGLRAPGDVLKILERQAEDIFKSGGSKPALNAAIRQLEELRGKIEDVAAECAGFDGLALELSRKKTALADLRRHKSELEEERRLLERRLGVWRQWDEWRMAGVRLERLTPVSESFPEDGPARLAAPAGPRNLRTPVGRAPGKTGPPARTARRRTGESGPAGRPARAAPSLRAQERLPPGPEPAVRPGGQLPPGRGGSEP